MTHGTLLATARDLGESLSGFLRSAGARRTVVAGDARRGVAMVSELLLLTSGLAPRLVAETVTLAKISSGRVKVSGLEVTTKLDDGGRLRVRVVRDPDWVKATIQETGDADHVAWLREVARERGGTFGRVARAARDERAFYRAVELAYVPPELREGAAPTVPLDLLGEHGALGVFHVHTDWSDGTASLLQMVEAARDAQLTYVGISDHSQAATYAHGLDAARLDAQAKAVDEARARVPGVEIFHGVEVDILADGSLDLDDETLAKLDFVIASVHTRHNMPFAAMTARIVRAVKHPLVTILGHPTGRILGGGKGYTFDLGEVARAATENGTFLEINANAHRLDLSDAHVREAAALGARFAIDPDAHATSGFRDTALGIALARRAALTSKHVLNTLDRDAMKDFLSVRREKGRARLGLAGA